MEKVFISTEYIKLDQFLKWCGIALQGAQAKEIVQEARVKVNGNIEMQRGKKLRKGDIVEVFGKTFEVDQE